MTCGFFPAYRSVKYRLTYLGINFIWLCWGAMIESFKHRGLRQLFEDDNPKGLNPEHVRKIRQILGVMHAAQKIAEMDVATFRLHPLTGDLKGYWSVTVRANWRIVFRFEDGKAIDVDLVDYH